MDQAKKPSKQALDHMSAKQVGRAAAENRKMAFHTGTFNASGYIVGADSYHWLVAIPSADGGPYTALVHKSCPVVVFTPDYLKSESEECQAAVEAIGSAFWEFCRRTYTGSSAVKEQEA